MALGIIKFMDMNYVQQAKEFSTLKPKSNLLPFSESKFDRYLGVKWKEMVDF